MPLILSCEMQGRDGEYEAGGLELSVCVMVKSGYPSVLHPTRPRKKREDGWGTRTLEVGQDF